MPLGGYRGVISTITATQTEMISMCLLEDITMSATLLGSCEGNITLLNIIAKKTLSANYKRLLTNASYISSFG